MPLFQRAAFVALVALGCTSELVAQVTGDLRLHEFESRAFGNVRQLRVLVPAGYDDPLNRDRRYPVLYLNDGQNLFDAGTSVFNSLEWRVDEVIDSLVRARRIDPLIAVGIDNAGRSRRPYEYLPWPDVTLRPPEPNPQGARLPAMVIDEVMPFIDARYRTRTGPASTGYGGSSYGGLATLFVAMARPGVFGRLLIESPSFYVDSAHVLRDAAAFAAWPERVYLGAGTNEGGRPDCRPDDPAAQTRGPAGDVRWLEGLLRARGLTDARVRVIVAPCGRHDEAAWAARLPVALEFLFGAR